MLRGAAMFTTFDELWDACEDLTPEQLAASHYSGIDYTTKKNGKVILVNALNELIEPFTAELTEAIGGKLSETQAAAIHTALSKAFGSGCIQTDRKNNRHLRASTDKRTRKAIEKRELLWTEYQTLGYPGYKDLSQHMLQEYGIKIKPSTCGHYIRRRLKQERKK